VKCRFFIVEDDDPLLDVLREIFEEHSCEVVCFAAADAEYDYLQHTQATG